jgi:hypothetical protein
MGLFVKKNEEIDSERPKTIVSRLTAGKNCLSPNGVKYARGDSFKFITLIVVRLGGAVVQYSRHKCAHGRLIVRAIRLRRFALSHCRRRI